MKVKATDKFTVETLKKLSKIKQFQEEYHHIAHNSLMVHNGYISANCLKRVANIKYIDKIRYRLEQSFKALKTALRTYEEEHNYAYVSLDPFNDYGYRFVDETPPILINAEGTYIYDYNEDDYAKILKVVYNKEMLYGVDFVSLHYKSGLGKFVTASYIVDTCTEAAVLEYDHVSQLQDLIGKVITNKQDPNVMTLCTGVFKTPQGTYRLYTGTGHPLSPTKLLSDWTVDGNPCGNFVRIIDGEVFK